jgi:hypothetical protein
MIRINCDTHADADAAWNMLRHVPDSELHPVRIEVEGVMVAVIGSEALLEAQPAHTCQPPDPEPA